MSNSNEISNSLCGRFSGRIQDVKLELLSDSDIPFDMDSAVLIDNAIVTGPAAPATPIEDGPQSTEMPHSKGRRKKSVVWEHFTVKAIGPGQTKANCNHCNRSFAYISGSKLAGTSHLKRHISLGICPGREKIGLNPHTPPAKSGTKRPRPRPDLTRSPLDPERCTHEIAKMIILHEYPIHIVEHPGFVNLVKTLQPQYNMASFNTVQGDIVGIYLKEKQKLLNVVSCCSGHVNLTLDLWTSNQTFGYVFLSGQFLDSNWKLHRRLLNVVMVQDPDSENVLNQAAVDCMSDWCLNSGVSSLTLDESISTESIKANLRGLLSVKNPLVINGQLVVGGCFARVLSCLSQEAIESMSGMVQKIRDSVKYVKTSESNNEKFDELKQHLQVPSTKEITVDDLDKWNTTYHMLVAACELKEVFTCFDASDPSYKLSPSMDDWKQVETLCSCLKLFFDAATILTSPVPTTTNIFFHEVTKIQLELAHAAMSEDALLSNLVRPLQEKFDNYWRECCLVLAIAVVMDPRFKMKLVEFTFQRIYGDDSDSWIALIVSGIHELYNEYSSAPMVHVHKEEPLDTDDMLIKYELPEMQQEDETTIISFGDGLLDFDMYISEITSTDQTKSELDQYLEEPLMPRIQEFDVLNWWKMNSIKYPTLSKMAADILSVPMSTVAPEAVFNTKSRHMDSNRSSLHPMTLEAVICARDWLLQEL